MSRLSPRAQVVIVGGGFGGMICARALKNSRAEITLIDRRNFHLFQPLLYQVATGGLSPANIASPLRAIFRKQRNVRVIMGEVCGFDAANSQVQIQNSESIPYDYLVVATGSTHHYFGKDELWASKAPGLKTIEDATEIRRRVLSAFERAEHCSSDEETSSLLTFVVVGGGPTGVEMAGAIAELARQTMRHDFRKIDPSSARVLLVENSKLVLDRYHPSLSAQAAKDLQAIGVTVLNETRLSEISDDHVVVLSNGAPRTIPCATVVWAAGVKASPLARALAVSFGLEAKLDRGGRIEVTEHCQLENTSNVFVIGDMAHFAVGADNSLPGVAPVAIQQGEYVGRRIARILKGAPNSDPFRYRDKGNMATIGRSHAIVESGRWRLSGRLAWLTWLFIHILYLSRFENRVLVLFQWFWNYVTRNRTARLITGESTHDLPQDNKAPTQ